MRDCNSSGRGQFIADRRARRRRARAGRSMRGGTINDALNGIFARNCLFVMCLSMFGANMVRLARSLHSTCCQTRIPNFYCWSFFNWCVYTRILTNKTLAYSSNKRKILWPANFLTSYQQSYLNIYYSPGSISTIFTSQTNIFVSIFDWNCYANNIMKNTWAQAKKFAINKSGS